MSDPAVIEYHGHPGSTAGCIAAVELLLHHGRVFTTALLLTMRELTSTLHGLLLTDDRGASIIIRAGFTSGYSGEGPRGLSKVLALLEWHGIELDEVEADAATARRLDKSSLTRADLDRLVAAKRIRPRRIWDYIDKRYYIRADENPWHHVTPSVPLAIINGRLASLARTFWDDPDIALLKAHRRLETIVRNRISAASEQDGGSGAAKLYASAVNGDQAPLYWPDVTVNERQGRVNLFVGTVAAYRNGRAHHEGVGSVQNQLAELLLVNHLFRLEATAKKRKVYSSSAD